VLKHITDLMWRIQLCGVQQDSAATVGASLC
jgi:hypothetical protein